MRPIDADALWLQYVEKMNELLKATNVPNISEEALGLLCGTTLIFHAPTVDAKPVRHGRWIKMTGMLPPEYHGHYECSECQWHMKGIRNSWTREEEMTYCPNCGAKMDGDGDVHTFSP